MKINSSDDTVVEREGLASDGSFKILFNAKMAKILSDGLYSDKIQSIIRELSCNAKDSHVESGQPNRPIEIHTPTQFEPWFHVRDFGIGLDHTGVVDVYTCYGVSTKTNSNDVIGQLGLGSKAPFSYVDAFDVTAYKDGVERQYSMYKDETGMPSVALLGEKPTTESNGLIIKMPVKQEDFNKFHEKAIKVFTWFDVKPIVIGGPNLNIPTIEYAFSGTNWKIRKKLQSGYYHRHEPVRPIALMGGVAYPIESNSISGLTRAQQILLTTGIVLTFAIGDLEIAASREALGYDVRTQANISKLLLLALNELAVSFETKMKSATTEWEARKIFGHIFGHENGFRNEFDQIFGSHGLTWKNKKITSADVTIDTADIWKNDRTHGMGLSTPPKLYTGSSSYKKARLSTYHQQVDIPCRDNTVIIFNDMEKGGLTRVNFFVETNSINKSIYYFDLINTDAILTQNEIVKRLGYPVVKLTSDLPKRPTNPAAAKTRMLEYAGSGSGPKSWKSVEVDIEAGGIYVILDIWEVKTDDISITASLENVVSNALELGILTKDKKVYAPRGDFKTKVKNHDDWISLWDLVKLEVNKRLTPASIQRVADSLQYQQASGIIKDSAMWKTKWNISNPSSAFAKFVESMRTLENVYNASAKDKVLISLAKEFGSKIQNVSPSVDPSDLYKKVLNTYPMMKFMIADRYSSRYISSSSDAKLLQDYVNSIDTLTELTSQIDIKELTTI